MVFRLVNPHSTSSRQALTPDQAEGYTRQEITFTGSVNIKQIGHATLYLARHDETYLIPLPNIKLKSILTGKPYPELEGTYYIPSTNGYMSCIDFSGTGLFSSSDKKHSFEATVYQEGEEANPLYAISGHWDGQFTSHDYGKDVDIETFDVMTAKTTPLITAPLSEQDPWESRRAWQGVREALESGNMQGAVDAKASIENGQREMRKTDNDGKDWRRLFYEAGPNADEVAARLAEKIGLKFDPEDTVGAWQFRRQAWEHGEFKKPYYGNLVPDNSHVSRNEATENARVAGDKGINGVVPVAVADAGLRDSAPAQAHSGLTHTTSFHQQTTTVAPETAKEEAESLSSRVGDLEPQAEPALPQKEHDSPVPEKSWQQKLFDLVQPKPDPSTDGVLQEEKDATVAEPGQVESGITDMSINEKAQVEEFLRDQYASRKSR